MEKQTVKHPIIQTPTIICVSAMIEIGKLWEDFVYSGIGSMTTNRIFL